MSIAWSPAFATLHIDRARRQKNTQSPIAAKTITPSITLQRWAVRVASRSVIPVDGVF